MADDHRQADPGPEDPTTGRGGEAQLDPPPDGEVRCGQRIGRYILGHRRGMGGGGVVYAAYDEALDRRVAVKVLWPGADDAEARAREAQAIAELRHPNIVTVFDAGVDRGRSFVVMELVDGDSLRQWLAEHRPGPAQIIAVLMQAARGLAHAHHHGFVHRDFKLDNVLIDRRGRVLVVDFGLASRPVDGPRPPEVGTPAYMAVEQHEGGVVGPAADQFALCVALFRSLHGVYPFGGQSSEERLAAKRGQPSPTLASDRLPARVQLAIARGLRPRPEDRFASVDALIVAIEGSRPQRRRWLGVAAVLVGMGALMPAILETESVVCPDMPAPWSRRDAVRMHRALRDSGAEYAVSTGAPVDQLLSSYAAQWTRTSNKVCAARRHGPAFTRTALDAIDGCLRRSRLEVEALATVLARAGPPVVEHAVRAAESLPHPADCWRHPRPQDDGDDPAWRRLEVTLAQAKAHGIAGMFETSVELARRAQQIAASASVPAVEARANLLRGRAHIELAQLERGRRALEAAFYGALELGDDDTARDAAVDLLRVAVHHQPDPTAAERWDRSAQALLRRAPPYGEAKARLLRARADHAIETGDPDRCLALHHEALAILRQGGRPSLALAESLEGIGRAQLYTGHFEPALTLFGEALVLRQRLLGPGHPWLALAHNNYGIALALAGQQDEAQSQLEAGLEILEASLGAEHPRVGRARVNLGRFALARGESAVAAAQLRQAATILMDTQGPQHRDTIVARGLLVDALRREGHTTQAVTLARTVLAEARRDRWPTQEQIVLYGTLGVALAVAGDDDGALSALAEARGRVELSAAHQRFGAQLEYWVAWVWLRQGHDDKARRLAEQAWDRELPADVRSMLALLRARIASRRGRHDQARQLAQRAYDELPSWGRADRRRRAEIEAWIDRLAAPPGLAPGPPIPDSGAGWR